VFSQRYAKPAAGKFFSTRAEQDRANMEKLLTELKKTSGPKTARFVTTLALSIEGITLTATGTLEGTIIDAPRGTEGFGYDPIFVPQGQTKTLAEMSHQEKNAISHRRKAVQELMAQMKSRGIIFAKP
jgi:XTP/dITP diphosphohydrolase